MLPDCDSIQVYIYMGMLPDCDSIQVYIYMGHVARL